MADRTRNSLLPLLARLFTIAAAAAAGVAMLEFPLSRRFVTPDGATISGWPSKACCVAYLPCLFALFVITAWLWRWLGKWGGAAGRDCGVRGLMGFAVDVLRPVILWPALVACSFGGDAFTGVSASSVYVPYGSALVAALMLERLVRHPLPKAAGRLSAVLGYGRTECVPTPGATAVANVGTHSVRPHFQPTGGIFGWLRRHSLAVLLAANAVFLGVCSTRICKVFDGGGDACHYQIQTENIVERGDLDLTEKMKAMMDWRKVPEERREQFLLHSHMRVNTDGRVHSIHTFGFPVLASVFRRCMGRFGDIALFIVLGMLALAGCHATCRRIGVAPRMALVACGLLALSNVWVLTEFCFLPEMLGCVLAAWAMWAIVAQTTSERGPVLATVVSALCCAALPYAHVRFTPMAMMLFGFFGIEGLLLKGEPFWSRKFPRLALYTVACVAGWAFFWKMQQSMFSGAESYNYGGILLACPIAMWGMLADVRGLVCMYPLVWWLVLAPLPLMFARDRAGRWAGMALGVSAAILAFCCSTEAALRGDCLHGRYFMQAVPILFPFGALLASKARTAGRVWYFFLAAIPVLLFARILPDVTSIDLVSTPYSLSACDGFADMWQPLADCLGTPSAGRTLGFVFVGGMLLFTLLVAIDGGRRKGFATFGAIVFALALASGFAAGARMSKWSSLQMSQFTTHRYLNYFSASRKPLAGETYFRNSGAPDHAGITEPAFVLKGEGADAPKCKRTITNGDPVRNSFERDGARWYPLRFAPVSAMAGGRLALWVKGRASNGPAMMDVRSMRSGVLDHQMRIGEGEFSLLFLTPRADADESYGIFFAAADSATMVVVDYYEFAPYMAGLESVMGALPEAEVFDFSDAGAHR